MCTREVVLWVHVWSARMSVRLQSGHFSAEKVVTCSATKPYLKGCFVRGTLLPLPPAFKRPAGTWKVCFHAASIARGAHLARRHVHAHVGSPWPADERVCLDMLCGIPFVFGVLLSELS